MAMPDAARTKILIAIALSVMVLLAYRGVVQNDFIAFDDPVYVTGNHKVLQGLNGETVRWAFTATHVGNWHPLTWISLMLDRELFETNPAGYHWTSVILHLFGGLLLFLALNRLTASPWRSGLVAALFLVHPLHVESVAWVAERKDVLSGLFWMMGIYAYAGYANRPGFARYLGVLLAFLCGLMSKPMMVTFPFVLLLLDGWPLRRAFARNVSWARLVGEKVPLFALSAVWSVVTVIAQKDHHAMVALSQIPLADRLANALVCYTAYLGKMLWPARHSVYYPYIGPPSLVEALFALVLLCLVTASALLLYRRRPYLLVGWLWYLGTLVPVIGFVQVGSQAMADRYTYLPLIGIFIMLVWGVADFLSARFGLKASGCVLSAAVLAVLVFLTHQQVGHWRDTPTLFNQALRNTESNFMAHQIMGEWIVKSGHSADAESHYREAIRIRPAFKQAYNGLGHLMMIKGKHAEAAEALERALQIDPAFVPAIKNLADVRMRQRRLPEALPLYRKALAQGGEEDPELWNNYGVALFFSGQREEARRKIREAIRLNPDYGEARENLQKILESEGRIEYKGAKEP